MGQSEHGSRSGRSRRELLQQSVLALAATAAGAGPAGASAASTELDGELIDAVEKARGTPVSHAVRALIISNLKDLGKSSIEARKFRIGDGSEPAFHFQPTHYHGTGALNAT